MTTTRDTFRGGLTVDLIPCRGDNYAALIRHGASGTTVLVDAPEAAAIEAHLDHHHWQLDTILITHHHHDHVAGVEALKARYGASVVAPAAEADRIPAVDRPVTDGDGVVLGPLTATVIATPGHTLGHVAYHIADGGLLFAGDTLFVLGCGRLFEGTPAMMWDSLSRLAALPDDTAVYCGHEYTLANAVFATAVDPYNSALAERRLAIAARRDAHKPTVPTTIGEERRTNPFLRADDPAIAAQLGMAGRSPVEVFAELRERKNRG